MKQFTSLVLCLCMIFACFIAGCTTQENNENRSKPESQEESLIADGSLPEQSDEASGGTSSNPYVNEQGVYVSKKLPEFDPSWLEYGTFNVLVYNNKTQTTYFSEEVESLYDTTDSKIFEAVNDRNKWIDDTYGIKVKAIAVDDVAQEMRKGFTAGSAEYQACMPFMSGAAIFAQEGNLYNLNEFSDYIDLEAPWWDQNANSSLSIANKVYFSTGDISLMHRIVSSGIAFNKKLMNESNPELDIYQLVRDGEWTLDKYYSMSKAFSRQGDDVEKMDENDIWGSMGASISLYYGAGETLCMKNSDDIPMIAIGATPRSLNVAQKVLSLLEERGTWYIAADHFTDTTDKWNKTVKIFGEDRALFYSFAFSALKKFRPYGVVYGILPLPKYDENQDDYFSTCSANYAYGVCIPAFVEDPEYSAYMIELMAIGGKNYLTDAYYYSVLKGKDANTEEDEEMLDIIFGNIVYDVATVYGFNGLSTIFNTATSETLVSSIDSIRDGVQDKIDSVVDSFKSQD